MFNWTAAEHSLYRISKRQIDQFLSLAYNSDAYGCGYFCDAFNGSVLLVANTEHFYWSGLHDFEARFGSTDMEAFRWEIGNWEYPAGLFPSASLEQREYAMDWQEFEQSMAELALPDHQERLELLALKVLKRLIDEGVFSQATSLKGYTILGPDDTQALLLKKKSRVDRHLNAGNK